MYVQFLIEDASTGRLMGHVMEKVQDLFPEKEILYNIKSFKGIGHLVPKGSIQEQKTGKILNDLPGYLRGFNKSLAAMEKAVIIVVLDNDKRDTQRFRQELEALSRNHLILIDHVYCIAVKEMEAWLLGDEAAIEKAYPKYKKKPLASYEQDGICETWEVLANAVFPGGAAKLQKAEKKQGYKSTIGAAKYEWADKIGLHMNIQENKSPSFRFFVDELLKRAEIA